MSSVVVIVSQWSDDGSGQIVDWLSERSDVTLPVAAGSDAGQVLVVNSSGYKLSLLRSHLVAPHKLELIGQTITVDLDRPVDRSVKTSVPGRQCLPGDESQFDDPLLSHHQALCIGLLRLACRL